LLRADARGRDGDRPGPFSDIARIGFAFAKGAKVTDPPQSLRDMVLLSHLPGYTRRDLDDEDPEWLEEVWVYIQTEAQIARQQEQKASRRGR
jgi:hypothetical protein